MTLINLKFPCNLLKILNWNKNIAQRRTDINHFKHTLREPTLRLPKQDKDPIENILART